MLPKAAILDLEVEVLRGVLYIGTVAAGDDIDSLTMNFN